jgi:hypothetical protein
VLVSRDVSSMPGYFEQFIQTQESPGLLLVHAQRPIGTVIEGLLLVWMTWTEEELRNRARWLPWQQAVFPAGSGERQPETPYPVVGQFRAISGESLFAIPAAVQSDGDFLNVGIMRTDASVYRTPQ